ncbi:hypothetical protein ACFQ8T_06840 [Isoptericola sp. NPDC056618]|uniref:hypothetical protein n=1 Tax=Isoptericola sp. NPDC056618 TaxID=3345878 RepID=UPI00368F7212
MNAPTLDAIATPGGGFAMVAMDQRESLRDMYDKAGAGRPVDSVLVDFKLAVADALGAGASGFLIDRHYGFEDLRSRGTLPAGTGLILAADALDQQDGGPVQDTDLDEAVVGGQVDLTGVAALKLLVIWRRDEQRQRRIDMVARFVAESRRLGVLSVLEPVVRATDRELADGSWDQQVAICEAAHELSPLGASLYKAQVPLSGQGTADQQLAASRELGDAVKGPWVVLSQGVRQTDFLPAVRAACEAGASGFLAGRALWSDVVGLDDAATALAERSVPRLEALRATVDAHATPWTAR